jgi:5-dehydro-2-deoxygluconokinase
MQWLERRARHPHTVLDLDLRPDLWADPSAATAAAGRAIALSSVVIGNRAECAMAVGSSEPQLAADALLARGVSLAVVKMGADGVLLASADERVVVDPIPVTVRCGSGAGDAFGGALATGLVHRWSLAKTGRLANASGALVSSRLTCADAMPTLPELEAFEASSTNDTERVAGHG